MNGLPGCRINGFAVGLRVPYADVGPFEAIVGPHPYLSCYDCGSPLCQGHTLTGVAVYACRRCRRVVDMRRVA